MTITGNHFSSVIRAKSPVIGWSDDWMGQKPRRSERKWTRDGHGIADSDLVKGRRNLADNRKDKSVFSNMRLMSWAYHKTIGTSNQYGGGDRNHCVSSYNWPYHMVQVTWTNWLAARYQTKLGKYRKKFNYHPVHQKDRQMYLTKPILHSWVICY